jgi:ribosomal protein L11 methyltransferase
MPRNYLSLRLDFDPVLPAREVAIAYLSEIGFDMFETDEAGLTAHAPEEQFDEAGLTEVLEELAQLAQLTHSLKWVEEENWNAAWEESFEPIEVEGLATMRAPFHPAPEKGMDLIIRPAMSFGTGHHPTTWMMLKALLQERLTGERILDMGSGTGVLGIAAWKQGAREVVCIDIEERAAENAVENFELNGWKPANVGVEVICGTDEALRGKKPFAAIFANINRNILQQQFPAYTAVALPGTILWTSGFFPEDVDVLRQTAEALGWKLIEQMQKGDWAAVKWERTEKESND